MEKQKDTIKNGSQTIKKKGKIVNQKQIDLWNAKTEEQKQSEIEEIDKKIAEYTRKKEELLEIDEVSKHERKAEKLMTTKKESDMLSQEIDQIENTKEQNK